MIRLRTLGDIGLEAADHPEALQLLRQAKPLAFLCYLILSTPQRLHRRDSLVALFWPDLDHEHGRAALRQTIRVIRRMLGSEVILNRGDFETGINPDLFWCDATAFVGLCEAGEVDRAIELYQGELLPGLHVEGAAPELMQWVDETRMRLRRQAREMVRRCKDRQRAVGDRSGAVRWARRALDLEPSDERALRSLIEVLDEAGDHSGAVAEYERFASELARDLEVLPSTETQSLVHRIRAKPPVDTTADPVRLTPVGPAALAPVSVVAPSGARWPWALAGAVLLLVVGLAQSFVGHAALSLQPSLVAVMPWRVNGADPSLAYLREGMLDLFDATLTGERGLRSTDPRTILRRWHDGNSDPAIEQALAIARQVGAGRVLAGSVVGTSDHLTLTISEFLTARPNAPVSFHVSGSVDSLSFMVERLTAELLAHESGEPGHRETLLTTSLPALRAYLEGRAAFRRGQYNESAKDLDQALTIDSSFTLAALSLAAEDLTAANSELMERGQQVAWRDSANLSIRDRALLHAIVGDHYPAFPDEYEYLLARRRFADLAPGNPEAQYWLADSYFHQGRILGLEDWALRAAEGFGDAIRLDSGFASPYQHLIELRLQLGDTVGVRGLAAYYFALDSTGEYRDFLRWRVLVGLGDSGALKRLRPEFVHMSRESLFRILGESQLEGIEIGDAELAVAALETQPLGRTPSSREINATAALWSNEGRPQAAESVARLRPPTTGRPPTDDWSRVANALFSDDDTTIALAAVARMAKIADRPDQVNAAADTQNVASCAVSLWRIAHHDSHGVGNAVTRLRRSSIYDPTGRGVWMSACAIVLDAELSAEQGTVQAPTALARLDSLNRRGLSLVSPLRVATTLVLARLYERKGNIPAALEVVRHRENEYNPRYLSTQLLEEARLATRLGERDEAIHAFRHYLTLRAHPEPILGPKVDSIRSRLAELEEQQH